MKLIKSILLIINYKTVIITLLSLISTWLCMTYNLQADFPLTLVGIAIVFPVVFSIDSAYKRRENALSLLADLRAHAKCLCVASNDWIDPENPAFHKEMKGSLIHLFVTIKDLFTSKDKQVQDKDDEVNKSIDSLSKLVMKFRDLGLPSGELSRVNQYVSKIDVAIENMKSIFYYRTPITLRAYSKVFIYSFPVLYGPYFVYVSQHYSPGLEYMMPIVFSFILVSLDNIQEHLESPFDQVGEDDIKFDVDEFSKMLD